ncbi:hypothetical protein [Deinococcus sp. 23YEL01]|uniref:hypothetical protein n=1 Tax=Deinococcus sp. 23YEL01 TaxID=2745871 RepID=UPI001E5B9E91|nr:hypothetical protein [Deinococcus sp. 23YEL01]MCD0169451.1 hypothetical protein [Deinococcus sp. 23YEL01]
MFKRNWLTLTAAALSLTAITLPSTASAADVTLGLNSSLGLGCQVAGVRAGLRSDRVGVYGQLSYCTSNLESESGSLSGGGGLTVDLFSAGDVTGYALVGGSVEGGDPVAYAGLGARYGLQLVPVEAYVEAGVQRAFTSLAPITAPRFSVGVSYRMFVENLQGAAVTPTNAQGESSGGGGAPADCKLTAEQDASNARSAATSAARSALAAAARSYSSVYSNVSYSVFVGTTSISGSSARVSGSVTLKATLRSSGESVGGTYSGTVNLVRAGCGWNATGYTQGE